jgi:hypothetical protein
MRGLAILRPGLQRLLLGADVATSGSGLLAYTTETASDGRDGDRGTEPPAATLDDGRCGNSGSGSGSGRHTPGRRERCERAVGDCGGLTSLTLGAEHLHLSSVAALARLRNLRDLTLTGGHR